MKKIRIYPGCILLISITMWSAGNQAFSQGTDFSERNKPSFFLGLSIIPSKSKIVYTDNTSIAGLQSNGDFAVSGSLDAGIYFARFIGISTGIGYSSYKAKLSLGSYQSAFNDTDTDSESYEMRVTGSGISEEQSLGFISIPLNLMLRLPISEKMGLFLHPGASFNIPVGKSFKSSGTFTYKGYYSAYNVLLENLPDYGFPTNKSSNSEGDMEVKSLSINAIVSGGIDFFVSENIQIAVAANYDKSLSTVANYGNTDQYQLSPGAGQINSLMGGYNEVTTQSIGARISLRYFFK
jgi:hypothetical protein